MALLETEECVRYIRLSNRYNIEVAMCAGLETLIGDIVVSIEPQCDPVALIPEFVEQARATGGVVYGIRTGYDATMPLSYRIGKRLFHTVCKLFAVSPPRDAGFLIGLSRAALNGLLQVPGKTKFLRMFGSRLGFNTANISYRVQLRRPRMRAKRFGEAVDYGLAVIFTNSPRPLRIVGWFGLFAALVNLSYALAIVGLVVVGRSGRGGEAVWGSLQNAAMLFLLFLMASFFIEYVTRTAENTREGPVYHVDLESNSNVMIKNETDKKNVCDTPQ
jgi:hypothetical protein